MKTAYFVDFFLFYFGRKDKHLGKIRTYTWEYGATNNNI